LWADICGWILGSVLGCAVSMRGLLNLHGSVVAIGDQAVALLGGPAAGKSTLAAAFVAAGHRLLSDDHVVLSHDGGRFCALPGPPRLRLWPESLSLLDLEAEHLPRVVGTYGKRYVDLASGSSGAVIAGGRGKSAGGHCDVPVPLAAVYVLAARDGARTGAAVEPLSLSRASHELLRKRFLSVSLSTEHTAAQFRRLSSIAQQVPVRLLHRPEGLDTLPDVVRAIQADLDVVSA
jgi:hypothetical protein